jgi:hypothetical protein
LYANCLESKFIFLDAKLLGLLFYSIQRIFFKFVFDNAFPDLLNLGHKKCVKLVCFQGAECFPFIFDLVIGRVVTARKFLYNLPSFSTFLLQSIMDVSVPLLP